MKINTAEGFLSYFRLGDASTRALVAEYAPSRDDHTIVDYSIPFYIGSGFGYSLYSYSFGSEKYRISDPGRERMLEYVGWRDPLSLILPDPDDARAVQEIQSQRDARRLRLR